jgi:arsenite-transporting ATPase
MRLVLYTGKGGVGKTTTAAATAVRAAECGRRTLVVSADAAHSLGDVLGQRLAPDPRELAPNLAAVEIDAAAALTRHWGKVREYLVAVLVHQGIEAVVADELALLPGAEEVMTLFAVEEYATSGRYDFIVVDCAPTDATLRLVTFPDIAHRALRVLLPLARMLSGVAVPIAKKLLSMPLPDSEVFGEIDELLYTRLASLQERITAAETSVRIVVTPERMVIDEALRSYTELSLFEVSCDAAIMNRLLPAEAGEEEFFRDQCRLQEERRHEVVELFAPLPVLSAPLREDEVTGLERLAQHGRELFAHVEPDAVLSRAPRVRFTRDEDGYRAEVPLPHADPDHLDVAKVDDELTITTGVRRRSIKLPRRVASLVLARARLEGPTLIVHFRDGAPAPDPVRASGPRAR